MMLQAAVSLLNIGSYRLSTPPVPGAGAEPQAGGRDLEQARDAIDGVRALMEILERRVPADELGPLRNALSQLQMAYAREMQATGAAPAADAGPGAGAAPGGDAQQPGGSPPGAGAPGARPGDGDADGDQGSPGPGPAESSGRLWVPGR
jgi:hypothetical protein